MKVYRQWLPCKRNSLYNSIPIFMQLCTSFFHGLKMRMWFGFNPAVIFCHFSTLLTLSVFAGATSTSPKFDLFCFVSISTVDDANVQLPPFQSRCGNSLSTIRCTAGEVLFFVFLIKIIWH